MLAFDTDWSNGAALVVVAAISTGGGVYIARINKSVKQINRAVNHAPDGAPTLVQRVSMIERQATAQHVWEQQAFTVLANQLGVKLPAAPPVELYIATADEQDIP